MREGRFFNKVTGKIPGTDAYRKEEARKQSFQERVEYTAKRMALEDQTHDVLVQNKQTILEAIKQSNSREIDLMRLVPGLREAWDAEIALAKDPNMTREMFQAGLDYLAMQDIYSLTETPMYVDGGIGYAVHNGMLSWRDTVSLTDHVLEERTGPRGVKAIPKGNKSMRAGI